MISVGVRSCSSNDGSIRWSIDFIKSLGSGANTRWRISEIESRQGLKGLMG